MEKVQVIKTLSHFDGLFAYLRSLPAGSFVAFDTETDGVDQTARVIGFSVCADPELAFYVILRYWDVETQRLVDLDTLEKATDFMLLLQQFPLVMQNAPFDCEKVLVNFGVDLMPHVHTDTLMLGHLLNENRSNGLKERGVELFGEDAKREQEEMKASVLKNGGVLTKDRYELYKADADLIAFYGAKDAILTLKIFYYDTDKLVEAGLDTFFYDDETMPLLRGPTYDLNTAGLKIDADALSRLRGELEVEVQEALSFVNRETAALVKDKYPGTKKTNTFNIGSGQQLAWLLFSKLNLDFLALTKAGKELAKALNIRPYSNEGKRDFIRTCLDRMGALWQEEKWEYCKKKRGMKLSRPKKIAVPWKYLSTGKVTLTMYAHKFKWIQKLLEFKKNLKLLKTYVIGIQSQLQYGVIRPGFLQHGTTSGRYSSRAPNFQNLPREDKRVKSCVISRAGNVFVGADYAQLEPRCFASVSQDPTLLQCFASGQDFYSVIGAPIFGKTDCSLYKDDENSFAKKYPKLRDSAKVFGLATPYGRTALQQAAAMGMQVDEAQSLIDKYFFMFPRVELMMLESHELANRDGVVHNLFGRPRRIPEAQNIVKKYGNQSHSELPYEARTVLNLAMNHRVQSTAASIMNRAAIAVHRGIRQLSAVDAAWGKVKIVLQVHDELVLEGPEELAEDMVVLLKNCMENTTVLPGVALVAEPKIAKNLADLK